MGGCLSRRLRTIGEGGAVTDPLTIAYEALRTQPVQWAKYLATEHSHIYQPIVHILFDRYETSKSGWLSPAEVCDALRTLGIVGDDFTEEACARHLDTLERNGTVIVEQDTSNASTLEEFLRAAKRYQISEKARRLELAIREILSDDGLRASLDPERLHALWKSLEALARLLEGRDVSKLSRDELIRIEAAWNRCEDMRVQIREQTERYLNALSEKNEPVMQDAEVFQAYRQIVRSYINNFLLDLKDFRVRSHTLYEDWQRNGTDEKLVEAIVRHQREVKGDVRSIDEIRRVVLGHLRVLIGFSAPQGDARRLETKALNRLMTLLAQVERIVRKRDSVADRRKDLEYLALVLRRAPSDAFARDLMSVVFGWATPRHMHEYALADHEVSSLESVWHQPAWQVELRPIWRGVREFSVANRVRDRRAERARLLKQRIDEREAERQFWDELFANGEIVLDDLTLPDIRALNRLVRVLRDCKRAPDHRVRLNDGSVVRLETPLDLNAVGAIYAGQGVLYTRPYRLIRTIEEAP